MFNKILVPFDGSNNSEKAVLTAMELAGLCGGEVVILTVYRHHSRLEASFSMVRGFEMPENMDDALRQAARDIADHGKAVARAAGDAPVRAFIKSGQPARTILAWAEDKNVDLIVLGSRGIGSVENFLLGSVSHKVTGMANCPVLVV